MTTYVFENMSATDAANFTSADTLIFSSTTTQPSDVLAVNSDNLLDLTTLTAGGKALTFSGPSLAGGHISFTNSFISGHSDSLFVGALGDNTVSITSADDGNVAYGFGGGDTITGLAGADAIYGGNGTDSIVGGAGNDHIYGFDATNLGTLDGADTLNGGDGNDYIQGNAGADAIDGGNGADRIFGGADNDGITGGNGNDTINGNKGDDNIDGGAGNDSLRGGQGNDVIAGGADNDIILGDLGNDTISGGTGLDIVTGGLGNDVFAFGAADSTFATTGALAFFTDTITDFTHGSDKIDLPGTIGVATGDVLHAQAGVVLSSVGAALTYAQQLLDAHAGTTDVAVLEVGSDAYMFYSGSAGITADSLIKLAGVDASVITSTDIM